MTQAMERPNETRLGVFSFTGAPELVATLASSGFDWICLDAQHGRYDDALMLRTVEVIGSAPAQVLIRVRALDAGLIGRALDVGAHGVIVPMVNSVEQAESAARATYYPPAGTRSFGPIRAAYGVDTSDTASVNDSVVCSVMIETAEGLESVDEIARVPGIGMLFVGPFDLALALGTTVDQLLADDRVESPLRRIAAAARQAGITAGAFAGTERRARQLIELGFRFVAVGGESSVIDAGAEGILKRMR